MENGNGTDSIETLTIKKIEYDALCDNLRHLLTTAKKIDKRSDRLQDVICNLNEEVKDERKILVGKVETIEGILSRLVVKIC